MLERSIPCCANCHRVTTFDAVNVDEGIRPQMLGHTNSALPKATGFGGSHMLWTNTNRFCAMLFSFCTFDQIHLWATNEPSDKLVARLVI